MRSLSHSRPGKTGGNGGQFILRREETKLTKSVQVHMRESPLTGDSVMY